VARRRCLRALDTRLARQADDAGPLRQRTMRERGVAVHEEAVLDTLLDNVLASLSAAAEGFKEGLVRA
jgi:hypothetical protein